MTVYGRARGKTVILLSTHGADVRARAHRHIGVVDPFGDGVTSIDEDHRHKIKDGVVVTAAGHGHVRIHYAEPADVEETPLCG